MGNLLAAYKFTKSYYRLKGLSHKEKIACLRFGLCPESPRHCPEYYWVLREDELCLGTPPARQLDSSAVQQFCRRHGFIYGGREPFSTIYQCYTKRQQVLYIRIASPKPALRTELESELARFNHKSESTEKPTDCQTCKYYHGGKYGGIKLVCGVRPYGYTEYTCSDYQPVKN